MKKNTFLLTLIGTVGAVAFTLVYYLIMTLVLRLCFSLRVGDASVFALLENTAGFTIAAFAIFEIVFFVWLFTFLAKEKSDKQDAMLLGGRTLGGKKTKLTLTKPAKIAGLAAVIILIGMVVVHANVYTEVSKDSVKQKSFVTTKEYTWDEVYRYSLSCDTDGSLKFTVQMTDGKAFEIFSGSNTCSDKFFEEFGDMLTYAGYLSDRLDTGERKIQKDIIGLEYMKQYYAESGEVWDKINRIVE